MEKGKNVVVVLSYLLYRDGTRLTEMSNATSETAIRLALQLNCPIIFSTAYDWWKKEAKLKRELAEKRGVRAENIFFLEKVADTPDEACKLKDVIAKTGSVGIIFLVTEWHHSFRAVNLIKKKFPGSRVEKCPVTVKRAEKALEKYWYKKIGPASGSKILYILWNWGLWVSNR